VVSGDGGTGEREERKENIATHGILYGDKSSLTILCIYLLDLTFNFLPVTDLLDIERRCLAV